MKKQYKFLEKENWFKHDFRSREDKKLIKLKIKWKSSAPIGVFWQLCEMIYENGGLLEYDIDVISYSCGDSIEIVDDVIKMCFIITEDDYLTHETIIEQLDERDEGYVKMVGDKSKAGKASAEAKKLAKKLEQQYNNSLTDVEQPLYKTKQHINTTQPEKRVESKEKRVESKEIKDKLYTVYTADDMPEITNTDIDNTHTVLDYEITVPMLDRMIDKFISVDNKFKLRTVMSEINEDYGGFNTLVEMYLPNDTVAQNNYINKLKEYENGIFA